MARDSVKRERGGELKFCFDMFSYSRCSWKADFSLNAIFLIFDKS